MRWPEDEHQLRWLLPIESHILRCFSLNSRVKVDKCVVTTLFVHRLEFCFVHLNPYGSVPHQFKNTGNAELRRGDGGRV